MVGAPLPPSRLPHISMVVISAISEIYTVEHFLGSQIVVEVLVVFIFPFSFFHWLTRFTQYLNYCNSTAEKLQTYFVCLATIVFSHILTIIHPLI